MNWERVIIHVDMNAYFVSVEQKSNPFLRGKPVVVVADQRRRSVILTASYEARKYGVRTGMNLYEGKKLCPFLMAVDGNSAKYLDSSERIRVALEFFSDQIQMTSCDEAYLDVTQSLKFFRTDAEGMARLIKEKIKKDAGLPCSVGVAPNKLLAKLASEKRKPDGLFVVKKESLAEMLASTAVEELCGIGPQLQKKLNALRVHNCRELGAAQLGFLQHHFGFWGYWLKRMGQGQDDSPVQNTEQETPVKSVGHSTTFPKDTANLEILKSYLMILSDKVAARLRRGEYEGKTLSLYVRYQDFTSFSKRETFAEYTNDGRVIYQAARKILENLFPLPKSIRLFGVSVSTLVPAQPQEFLFEEMSLRKKINETNDQINDQYGRRTIRPLASLYAERFGILDAPIPPAMHKFKE